MASCARTSFTSSHKQHLHPPSTQIVIDNRSTMMQSMTFPAQGTSCRNFIIANRPPRRRRRGTTTAPTSSCVELTSRNCSPGPRRGLMPTKDPRKKPCGRRILPRTNHPRPQAEISHDVLMRGSALDPAVSHNVPTCPTSVGLAGTVASSRPTNHYHPHWQRTATR